MSDNSGTVFYVMGVSGSGKTTVGRLLAENLGFPFFDGDAQPFELERDSFGDVSA